ncbi:xanthine dehydrogenase subunit XdhC [Lancefieldella rimae]
MDQKILKCTVNGQEVQVGFDPRESLLDTLRNRLGLTSVKRGCEVGECGACTVLIDGVATDTCLYLTEWAQGKDILTTEGLQAPDGTLDVVQQAFVDEFAVQCGFCIPGLIMSAEEIVRSGKTYTRDELRKMLSGHLCRCTGYQDVMNAVEKAVNLVNGMVGEDAATPKA